MRPFVVPDYLKSYKKNYRNANLALLKLQKIIDSEHIDNRPLTAYFDEERLQEIAELKSLTIKQMMADTFVLSDRIVEVTDYLDSCGIEIPQNLKKDDYGLAVRASDSNWWRRQLRKASGRFAEKLALAYGLVTRHKMIYCSDIALKRFRDMKQRNRMMMENTILVNGEGQEFTLQEISDKTVANPTNRRHELMTRIRGFEEYAKHTGKAAVFLTFTAPSKYHARSSKYNGATPRDTQNYHNRVWARIRAQLAREEIEIFGFRVAEPHHDGTPHGHFLLFCEPKLQTRLVQIADQYALQEDGTEKGARKHRLTVEFIDRRKGSAASYIAKYIAKNIDGFGVDNDLYGFDSASSAERITAWASLWGIRQFQQIGGIPVTVWRTLRRIESEFDDEQCERARSAADNGEWDLFLRHSQAAGLELLKEQSEDLNKYGEPVPPQVIGVFSRLSGEIGLKIIHQWEPRKRPWTCVNNCTQELERYQSWLFLNANDFSPDKNSSIYKLSKGIEQ